MNTVIEALQPFLAHQQTNQGAIQAAKGAVERLSEPDWIDIVSPFFAFTLVIVLPMCVALWVIVRTLMEKDEAPANANLTDTTTATETSEV